MCILTVLVTRKLGIGCILSVIFSTILVCVLFAPPYLLTLQLLNCFLYLLELLFVISSLAVNPAFDSQR